MQEITPLKRKMYKLGSGIGKRLIEHRSYSKDLVKEIALVLADHCEEFDAEDFIDFAESAYYSDLDFNPIAPLLMSCIKAIATCEYTNLMSEEFYIMGNLHKLSETDFLSSIEMFERVLSVSDIENEMVKGRIERIGLRFQEERHRRFSK